jgi:hypothetical protein
MNHEVQQVRRWLASQPLDLALLTLIVLLTETVTLGYGKEAGDIFENDLRNAYIKAKAGQTVKAD